MSHRKPDPRRSLASIVAWSLLGKPYIWGGDDPIQGYDCSGYVIEILKSIGILPAYGDWTAHGLWSRFEGQRVADGHGGCLVFFGSPEKVTHVEYVIMTGFTLGASGGGSRTKTEADAVQQNAYIKLRPVNHRSDIVGFVDPYLA